MPSTRLAPILLLAMLVLSGCARPGDPSLGPASSDAGSSALPATALSPANGTAAASVASAAANATPETPRLFHFRLADENGTVLLSSWPDENGTLLPSANPSNASPYDLTASRKFPAVLEPFREMILAAPPNATIDVRDWPLALPAANHWDLARSIFLPIEGRMDTDQLAAFGGPPPRPGPAVFGKTLAVNITAADERSVWYRFELPDGLEFPVPRTTDLFLSYHALPNGTAEFRFEAPNGTFESLGCQPVPGTVIPPGHYVIVADAPDHYGVRRYLDDLDRSLDGRTVTLTATLLN